MGGVVTRGNRQRERKRKREIRAATIVDSQGERTLKRGKERNAKRVEGERRQQADELLDPAYPVLRRG